MDVRKEVGVALVMRAEIGRWRRPPPTSYWLILRLIFHIQFNEPMHCNWIGLCWYSVHTYIREYIFYRFDFCYSSMQTLYAEFYLCDGLLNLLFIHRIVCVCVNYIASVRYPSTSKQKVSRVKHMCIDDIRITFIFRWNMIITTVTTIAHWYSRRIVDRKPFKINTR